MNRPRFVWLGDSCVSIQFGDTIDPAVNARCVAAAASIETRVLRGIRDVVPSYAAVTIHFDPRVLDRRSLSAELDSLAIAQAPVSYTHLTLPTICSV